MTSFKKQSWVSVLLLSGITFGIYIPFWFKRIKKETDEIAGDKPLNKKLVGLLPFLYLIAFILSAELTVGEQKFTLNYFGIGDLLLWTCIIIFIVLAFMVRSIIEKNYKADINPLLTFFLGPIYLQKEISDISKQSATPSTQTDAPVPSEPAVNNTPPQETPVQPKPDLAPPVTPGVTPTTEQPATTEPKTQSDENQTQA